MNKESDIVLHVLKIDQSNALGRYLMASQNVHGNMIAINVSILLLTRMAVVKMHEPSEPALLVQGHSNVTNRVDPNYQVYPHHSTLSGP